MSVVLLAFVDPKPEHRDEVIRAFEETIARAHTEEGCELYALHEAKDRLVMIEKWAGKEALAAHAEGSAFTELTAALEGKLAAPLEILRLRPHPAGTDALGAL